MKGFLTLFVNELRAVVRSKTLLLQLLAAVAWMFAAPRLFTGDGTAEGLREMTVHFSLGGVAAMLSVSLLFSATGAIAKERATKRLALTLVRPVRYFGVAWSKMLAHTLCGAFVLAVCLPIEWVRQPATRCRHVLKPVVPSLRQEAEEMYGYYMASSNTPAKVKAAKREVVIRLLANRAKDRYDTVDAGSSFAWRFDFPDDWRVTGREDSGDGRRLAARLRFSASFDRREDVCGELTFGGCRGAVSNITQSVVEIPLARVRPDGPADGELVFRNAGANPLMLRPRKDVELLAEADSFGWNLLRAYLELVAMISLLTAFGVFLGAGLGRPAALFTAISALVLSEMAPSVIDQYADELETDRVDAVGLAITRAATTVSKPVSAIRPLEALSLGECVEPGEVCAFLAVDSVCLPIIFSILSALVIPRKQDA